MAFSGYLVKIKGLTQGQSDYIFPNEYILIGTYKPVRGIQDKDSYRDGDGVLHRNALSHDVNKMEFQTRSMTNTEYDSIMDNIRARYTNAAERKVVADIYLTETGGYTGFVEMYMPDPDISIMKIIDNHTLKYSAARFALIGY